MKQVKGITWRQLARAATNAQHDQVRDGVEDYSMFTGQVKGFCKGIDEGYFAEGKNGRLYVCTCGTNRFPNPVIDWISNLNAAYNCKHDEIKSHAGFTRGVLALISEIEKTCKNYKSVVFTGHSRGHPINTGLARHIRWMCVNKWDDADREIWNVGFGGPAFYNAAGAAEYRTANIGTVNFRYHNDPVPQVPPAVLGYEQITLTQIGNGNGIWWPLDHLPRNYIDNV